MIRLHEAAVGPDEIDSLGHMNMRYYGARAHAATLALFARLGLDPGQMAAGGLALVAQDCFNHYLKEQFAGATLIVDGGVCDVRADGLSLYLELVNQATGDRAATFITKPKLYVRETRAPAPMPRALLDAAEKLIVDVPPHGMPRSIDLAAPRTDARYADVERRIGSTSFPFGRGDIDVPADECDAFGFLDLTSAQDIMFSAFAARARAAGMRMGPPIEAGPDGRRIGWAMLENRQYLVATPRVGDHVTTLSAPVKLGAKTQQMRRWTFNTETGDLLAVIDGVSLALDLDARRATDIPDYMRQELESQLMAELV